MRRPDFYLSTAGEYQPLASPRACWKKTRLSDDVRDDHMLIEIRPALDGQRFGLGDKNVSSLIISSRHCGQSLYPISEWPLYVYVARILDDRVATSGHFSRDQVELVAWGSLFQTLDAASHHAAQFG
jgi:hypothetical protein